jgi:hypothetical protein
VKYLFLIFSKKILFFSNPGVSKISKLQFLIVILKLFISLVSPEKVTAWIDTVLT